jgi:hypothetical protein
MLGLTEQRIALPESKAGHCSIRFALAFFRVGCGKTRIQLRRTAG